MNLDEYRGLTRDNDQSYYYFMHEHLFDRVNIKPENTNVPDGTEPDADKECARYGELIGSMGGVDIQLLGPWTITAISGLTNLTAVFAKATHCVESDREHDRGEQKIFCLSGRRAASGIYDGNRNDHEGKEDPAHCQWRGQG